LVLGAMIWLTRGVLAAERERVAAEHERTAAEARADLEERTRLALWRMDALGAAIMLRENRYPANPREIPVDSPFLTSNNPEVLLRFEIRKGGEPTSPELAAIDPKAAAGNAKVLAERKERLRLLRTLLAANPLPGDEWTQLDRAAQEGQVSWDAVPKDAPREQEFNTLERNQKTGNQLRQEETYQARSNTSERAQRGKAVAQTMDNANAPPRQMIDVPAEKSQAAAPGASAPGTPAPGTPAPVPWREALLPAVADVAQMRGVWVAGELFLLRRVIWNIPPPQNGAIPIDQARLGKQSFVQGVWLDSRVLRAQLLREVADLLPQACLAAADGHAADDPLAMVSFPFRLERNETLVAARTLVKTPFTAPLWVAWSAVALAVLTSSLLVRGVMRLSERRASFVSAVTHELRTPLTTFRLYSDMLESGAVKEEKRGEYLRVLAREADRLSHLVENVLAFSRIERGTARSNVRIAATGNLLEQTRERLEARLATAGLSLNMDSSSTLRVRVDTAAVEHILFNLIDNAAKYAATSEPPVVDIRVPGAGRHVEIIVSDHGPGIPPSERGRIFQAFHKSAREAAESQPGVGLGLALSRRLAKAQGGELECAGSGNGACFILRLPAA
ncbi:MAG: HAMP domain-containing sensor histidine kinase, partial [Verrucomicrobia bacterium]|nr:HAMP domain-containing sensor histidine kinase [Verrucomicrobiota bacterium]